MEQLANLDWQRYIFSDGGNPPYYATHNIPLAPTRLGQYRIEMSIYATGFADDVRVRGNYRIFDAEGHQMLADQRGIEIHYSDDLVRSAARWIDRYVGRR